MSSIVKLVASLIQSPIAAVTVYAVPAVTPVKLPSAFAIGPPGMNVYVKSESNPLILALPAAEHVGSSISTIGASGVINIGNIVKLVVTVVQPSAFVAVTIYVVPNMPPVIVPSVAITKLSFTANV